MATPQTIAADYEAVKNTIKQMNEQADSIKGTVRTMLEAIHNANDWRGPDAEAHKTALKEFGKSINQSCNWMKTLDATFSAHAYKLYKRAMNNAKADQFR